MRGFVQILGALVAGGLIVAGVGLWSVSAGLITAGLFLLVTLYIDAYLRHPTNGGPPR